MNRTQLYLAKEQHEQARRIASETGQTLSDVVRAALDEYLARRRKQRRDFLTALDQAGGIWRHRSDITSARELRRARETIQ